jgi:hypothetical protein
MSGLLRAEMMSLNTWTQGLCEEFIADSRDGTPHTKSQDVGINTQHELKNAVGISQNSVWHRGRQNTVTYVSRSHGHQGRSTAGKNDTSTGHLRRLPTGISPQTLPRRRSTKTTKTNGRKEKALVPSLSPPSYILSMSEKFRHDSLNAEGWIGDKPFLVTIDTGVSMMTARPNITA